jgi:hypothetical protein
MKQNTTSLNIFKKPGFKRLGVIALLLEVAFTLFGDTLSNNLNQPTDDRDAVTADVWSAAAFSTTSSAYALTSVTLLMDQYAPGSAQLALFSDSGSGNPGSLVGILDGASSYTSDLSPTVFNGNGMPLMPDTNYWLVLSAPMGGFEWAFGSTNSGSGSGFNHRWSSSFDGGASWESFDAFPYQMSVDAALVSAAPEPATPALLFVSAGILFCFSTYRRKSTAAKAAIR